jgi:cytochrome P450
MISMDDPRHARLRRIVSRGFTAKMVNSLTDNVTQVADDIVDEVIECDAVEDIAAKLPLRIICDMMGVQDPEYVTEGEDAFGALFNAIQELTTLLPELATFRVTNPGDDLISKLLSAEINGEALTPAEPARLKSPLINGIKRLPVAFTPGSAR